MQIKITMRNHLTPVRMAIIKKNTYNILEKKGPFYTVGGNVIYWCSHVEIIEISIQYRDFSKKLTIELPYDPEILLLAIYPKIMKMLIWKHTCTTMFTSTADCLQQSRYRSNLSVHQQMNKENVYTQWNTTQPYRVKCYHLQQHGWYCTKWNKSEKDKYCIISPVWGI